MPTFRGRAVAAWALARLHAQYLRLFAGGEAAGLWVLEESVPGATSDRAHRSASIDHTS